MSVEPQNSLEFLRYGALGVAALALLAVAGLLVKNPELSAESNKSARLFMLFAFGLALFSGAVELLGRIYPSAASVEKVTLLEQKLAEAESAKGRLAADLAATKAKLDQAEAAMRATGDLESFKKSVLIYADSIKSLITIKECLDSSSVIPDENNRKLIVSTIKSMNVVVDKLATAAGVPPPVKPSCL